MLSYITVLTFSIMSTKLHVEQIKIFYIYMNKTQIMNLLFSLFYVELILSSYLNIYIQQKTHGEDHHNQKTPEKHFMCDTAVST